ncbi:MAG: VOC family protein [Nanoarchaeota archaeon]
MRYVCALFVVDDIEESKDFYVNTLEQKIKYDFGENVTFEGDFALHEKNHFSGLIGNRLIYKPANNSELYFEYDNLEVLQNKLKKEKVEFIHEMKEQPWRQRVLRFYDPSKNIIEIGESIEYLAYRLWQEGKTIEEIGEITNMGIDNANEIIEKYK